MSASNAASRQPAVTSGSADQGDANSVVLDLDTLERKGGDPVPFVFTHEQRRYLLADPRGMDWQELLVATRSPRVFFQLALPPDDHDTFFGSKMPGWKMEALMSSYLKHYGLPNPGE